MTSTPPPAAKQTRATEAWHAAWYGGRRWSFWLLPLTGLFVLLTAIRRYILLHWRQTTLATPLVVVGNISVGGTGKTPLLMALVKWLQAQGYTPGVVSRGYGGAPESYPYLLTAESTAQQAGDEPLTIFQQTGCAVCVSPDRVAAARYLEDQGCDILLSDDGLQHYRLGRDIEIAVVDGQRGLGNGWRLPVGPLREPAQRLATVDWVVVNSPSSEFTLEGWETMYTVPMQIHPCALISVATGETHAVSLLAGQSVNAVAGIGNPQRFVNTLREAGMHPHLLSFPDHHAYSAADLALDNDWPLVMTEKDAVKCRAFAQAHWYYLSIEARLPDSFWLAFEQRLTAVKDRKKALYGL